MEPFHRLTSRTVLLPHDDLDTDQIVPARFLKGTSRQGLGQALFADRRWDASGRARHDFVLNHPEAREAQVLVAGRNFGCGSSREHAVWAVQGFGFRAVIARSFADIFRGNALKNGLLPVALDPQAHASVMASGGEPLTIDLESCRVTLPSGFQAAFEVPPFARYCLLQGVDPLDFLLGQEAAISAYEAGRASPCLSSPPTLEGKVGS